MNNKKFSNCTLAEETNPNFVAALDKEMQMERGLQAASMSEVCVSETLSEFNMVLFNEKMVMVRYLVGHAKKREEAEYYFRILVEQVKYLSRKHGLSLNR